jgi:hypothetical protein
MPAAQADAPARRAERARSTEATLSWLLAVPLFLAALLVYAYSVPASFNTRYENRAFFDSDGEFITRQYRQGSTFTHNDHLLYHVLAKLAVRAAGIAADGAPDIVGGHLALSVFFGALGIATLYLGGLWLRGDARAALAAALLAGGTAGYWFFSATIDTYVPHLWAAIVALLMALKCLRDQRVADYGWLGLAASLAFLFRTDAALLATLGIVAFADRPPFARALRRLGLCAGVVAVAGFGGYALVANLEYGVAPADLFRWMLGFGARPEVAKGTWGTLANFSPGNLHLTALNHLSYAIVIPGIERTRSAAALANYAALGAGLASWLVWAAAGLAMAAALARDAARPGARETGWILALAAAWIVPRIAFYCWWDPHDPFLFAVLSVPAIWLAAFAFAVRPAADARASGPRWRWILVLLLAIALWLHNAIHLIGALRAHA